MIHTNIRHLYVVFALIVACVGIATAQQLVVRRPAEGEEDWRLLRKALDFYDAANYGDALAYAELAKQSRRREIEWREFSLDTAQRSRDVRRAGDNLTDVLPVLEANGQTAAKSIIEETLNRYGESFFGNSFQKVKDFIALQDAYPEADFLIGKIYRVEGESALAFDFMNRALRGARWLDVMNQQYDMLYELADLSYDLGRLDDYEKYLLLVLKDDRFYTNPSFMNAMLRTLGTETPDAVEKFFLLYRDENDIPLEACALLSDYYKERNQLKKALECSALGAVISFSKLFYILRDRIPTYNYTNLSDLLLKAADYEDIVVWGNNNKVWELFYSLSQIAAAYGKPVFSRTLLEVLASAEPEPYWQKKATASLAGSE